LIKKEFYNTRLLKVPVLYDNLLIHPTAYDSASLLAPALEPHAGHFFDRHQKRRWGSHDVIENPSISLVPEHTSD
jgi:hypothetical protein